MARRKNFAGIDYFRFAAAFMVIAIHTAPFASWNKTADYLITYCLARVAVPFFFMTTGFFVLAPYLKSGFCKKDTVRRFLLKNTTLYLAVSALYLPVIIYSGKLPHSVTDFLKKLFFDGTFYHLWYFPAVFMGCLLLIFLCPISFLAAAAFSMAAYVIGLFGDSYYGLVKGVPVLSESYDILFQISSHTRNGIFFAPVFILLGACIAVYRIRVPKRTCIAGLAASLLLLLAEGYFTYSSGLQKHNSMYLFLLPSLFFLFQLLLKVSGQAPGWIRNGSMLLYIIHPAVIVLWHKAVKAVKIPVSLADNNFIEYLAVCVLSAATVYFIHFFKGVITTCTKKDAHG